MCTAKRLLDREFNPETCYELLPEWQGLDVRISQLSGGITNKLYRIQSEKGDYTVRIYGDKTELFINRDHEAHAITEMCKLGVAAPLADHQEQHRGGHLIPPTTLTNHRAETAGLREHIPLFTPLKAPRIYKAGRGTCLGAAQREKEPHGTRNDWSGKDGRQHDRASRQRRAPRRRLRPRPSAIR